MYSRERMIRERLAHVTCGVCGTPYLPERMVVLAHRPAAWMIMIACARCQERKIFLVSFAEGGSEHIYGAASSAWDEHPPNTPQSSDISPPFTSPTQPISFADVDAIHEFLQTFTGDFQTAFARGKAADEGET